ncbi:MAG: cytochrome b N-terminal domain-containing protein [Dehalococcoidia bacterium]
MRWVMRTARWFEDRTGMSRLVLPFFRHPVPPGTASARRGWWYVFGVATLAAFVLQVVTGIALATAYVPSAESAYDSLQFISHDATFGRVLRGLHYFGASAMVVMVGVHMIRVFLTGSFKFPREMNWLTGVVLLALTLAMAFTGQLLRWDQDGLWSVVIAAEQAGRVPAIGAALARFILAGRTVGAATLSRFSAFHMFFIPALIFAVVGFHLYLVLHNGISEPPEPGRPVDPQTYRAWYRRLIERHGRPYWPDAAWREVAFAVLMIVTVALLAITFGPKELGKPPDPTVIEAYPRPDWYFLWYFAVLALIRPGIEDAVIVLAPLIGFGALVALPFIANRGERAPARRPWAVGVVLTGVLGIATLSVAGARAPWSPMFAAKAVPASIVGVSNGPAVRGAQLFHDKGCQYCHAVAGQGGARGPALTHVATRLTAADITARILIGPGNMPSYTGNLSPDEVRDLVAFLEALDGRKERAGAP